MYDKSKGFYRRKYQNMGNDQWYEHSCYECMSGDPITYNDTQSIDQIQFGTHHKSFNYDVSPRSSFGGLLLKANRCDLTRFKSKGTVKMYFGEKNLVMYDPAHACNSIMNCGKAYQRYYSGDDLQSPASEVYRLPQPGERLYDVASIDFYNQAHDMRFNLLLALKERQMTIDLITQTANKLAKAAANLRKGRWKKCLRILGIRGKKPRAQRFSEQWLEYAYGWSPLLQDVYGAMIATVPPVPTFPIKSSRNEEFQSSYYGIPFKGTRRVTMKAIATVDEGAGTRLLSVLGITNPALVLWESVPFSFVVDWFLPVGNWLGSMSPLVGISLNDSSVTRTGFIKSEKVLVQGYSFNAWSWHWKISIIQQPEFWGYKKVRTLGVPEQGSLHFKNPLSPTHALNAVTLLTSVLRLK